MLLVQPFLPAKFLLFRFLGNVSAAIGCNRILWWICSKHLYKMWLLLSWISPAVIAGWGRLCWCIRSLSLCILPWCSTHIQVSRLHPLYLQMTLGKWPQFFLAICLVCSISAFALIFFISSTTNFTIPRFSPGFGLVPSVSGFRRDTDSLFQGTINFSAQSTSVSWTRGGRRFWPELVGVQNNDWEGNAVGREGVNDSTELDGTTSLLPPAGKKQKKWQYITDKTKNNPGFFRWTHKILSKAPLQT